MEAWYSITNGDFTIYNKKTGVCVEVVRGELSDIITKYNLENDNDLHITL